MLKYNGISYDLAMSALTTPQSDFLPDLCRPTAVLIVVLVCELLAIILTLGTTSTARDYWHTLSLMSLYTQWIGLSSATLTCLLRKPLSRLPEIQAGLLLYIVLILSSALISELAYQLAIRNLLHADEYLRHIDFVLRSVVISAILHAFALRYLYIQVQWRKNTRAEADARFQALQARIRPHFLFNTMNTIAGLIPDRPKQAEAAIIDLSELLHASLSNQQTLCPLSEELNLCHHYLHLEQFRLAQRLQLKWDSDAVPASFLIPPLTLQPLLENAIYHGIEHLPDGGQLSVSITHQDNIMQIDIRNPLPPQPQHPSSGHRIAQQNVRQRLQLAYHGRAEFSAVVDNNDYLVTLRLPLPQ